MDSHKVNITHSQERSDNAKTKINLLLPTSVAVYSKEIILKTTALRVQATIDELEFGGADAYFEKLKVTLNVFVNEGVDLKIGQMDVPEGY